MIWRTFLLAFVRKVAYLAAAIFFGFLFGHHAFAQSQQCTVLTYTGNDNGNLCSPSSSAQACASQIASQVSCGGATGSVTSDPGAPGVWTGTITYTDVWNCTYAHTENFQGNVTASQGACPVNCANQPNMDLLVGLGQSSGSLPGGNFCVNGCQYSNGNLSVTFGGGANLLANSAVSAGVACSANAVAPTASQAAPAGTDSSMCVSNGSAGSTCVEASSNGTYSTYVGGNSVVPANITNGTCVGYSSGAVACAAATGSTSVTSPPGPDNGTAGAPATPDAVISTSTGGTVNYYSPSTVSKSTVGAVTTGALGSGSNCSSAASCAGSGASSAASGASSASGSDSASGGQDCTAPPSCTGDPVYCAILNQQWLDRCYTVGADAVASALGVQAGEGSALAGSTVDLSSAVSESGPISLGGSCPAPITVNVMGQALTLDIFGKACVFAGFLGSLILSIAYFSAGVIMWKGVMS